MYNYESRKLSFQLVPGNAWYKNLRSEILNWNEISSKVRRTNTCKICGKHTNELDAHEVWEYDDTQNIQLLKDIIPVCKECHTTIHIGLAQKNNQEEAALEHYCVVNNCTLDEAEMDEHEAFTVWMARSLFNKYSLDKQQLIDKVLELTGITCILDFNEPINGRYYAKIDYNEKDRAKHEFGAKFDWDKRLWYFMSLDARNKWYDLLNNTKNES